jgi:hypothetical protein
VVGVRERAVAGFEAHADIRLARSIYAQTTIDFVHGEITGLGQPMPGFRRFVSGRAACDRNALQIGGDVTAAARQARVFGYEQPTASATSELLRYTFLTAGRPPSQPPPRQRHDRLP